MTLLPRSFFARPSREVAREFIGVRQIYALADSVAVTRPAGIRRALLSRRTRGPA